MPKLKKLTDAVLKQYTLGEELLNSISHGAGALLGIAGTVALIIRAVLLGNVLAIVSSAIYGFSLIVLYTMSTLYHAITNSTAKKVFRVLDHSSIYLLIAGTYTPYALVTLHGNIGGVILWLVWGAAVFGIVLNCISVERFKKVSLVLYIASGWAVVISVKGLVENLPLGGIILMAVGGIFYTGGIAFYIMKKKKFFHGIWHFCVLAGSLAHYFSIFFYVIQ